MLVAAGKTYTVRDAITAAKARLKAKNVHELNVTCLQQRDLDQEITLEKLNEISDDLVSDTLAYL